MAYAPVPGSGSATKPLANNGWEHEMASYSYPNPTSPSPLGAVSQYPADMSPGDVMDYRQGSYAYGNKGYYGAWSNTYPDENAEYPVNYPPYQMMGQDPVHMMQGYGRYGSS